MATARYFAESPEVFLDAVGTASKLLALLRLGDDDRRAPAGGEPVHGVTLQRPADMSLVDLQKLVGASTSTVG